MLCQRLQRWPNIKTTLDQLLSSGGVSSAALYRLICFCSEASVWRGNTKSSEMIESEGHNIGERTDQTLPEFTGRIPNPSAAGAVFNPLGYERVYLPLEKAADTPFYIEEGKRKL